MSRPKRLTDAALADWLLYADGPGHATQMTKHELHALAAEVWAWRERAKECRRAATAVARNLRLLLSGKSGQCGFDLKDAADLLVKLTKRV